MLEDWEDPLAGSQWQMDDVFDVMLTKIANEVFLAFLTMSILPILGLACRGAVNGDKTSRTSLLLVILVFWDARTLTLADGHDGQLIAYLGNRKAASPGNKRRCGGNDYFSACTRPDHPCAQVPPP